MGQVNKQLAAVVQIILTSSSISRSSSSTADGLFVLVVIVGTVGVLFSPMTGSGIEV